MIVVVTNNVPARFRGFLASCMLEIAPGVYTSPKMNAKVRMRIWDVLLDWSDSLNDEFGIVMTWRAKSAPGGQAVRVLGYQRADIVEHEGLHLLARKRQYRSEFTEDGLVGSGSPRDS